MERIVKSFDAKVVTDQTDPTSREFTAIVAAYGVVDDEGDMILPGAFAGEVDRIRRTGQTIPVIWDHDHKTLESHIGVVTDIADLAPGDTRLPPHLVDKGGLWVRAEVDDDAASIKAHKLMKGGRVRQFSFVAMDGKATPTVAPDGSTVRAISEVRDLVEVGPTLRGMNTATTLLSIKSNLTAPPSPSAEATDDTAPGPEPVADPSDADRARYLTALLLTT